MVNKTPIYPWQDITHLCTFVRILLALHNPMWLCLAKTIHFNKNLNYFTFSLVINESISVFFIVEISTNYIRLWSGRAWPNGLTKSTLNMIHEEFILFVITFCHQQDTKKVFSSRLKYLPFFLRSQNSKKWKQPLL